MVKIVQPVPGLHMALDPRIPDELEKFPFKIETRSKIKKIEWLLDDKILAVTEQNSNKYLWSPRKGHHKLYAKVEFKNDKGKYKTHTVGFWVR